MTEPIVLGPKIDPPRGGLLRLQQAVRQREGRGYRAKYWMMAGITVCLVVLALLILSRGMFKQRRFDSAMQQALTAPPGTHFDNGAYLTLPSHGRNVRILLVASLSPAQPALTTDKKPD